MHTEALRNNPENLNMRNIGDADTRIAVPYVVEVVKACCFHNLGQLAADVRIYLTICTVRERVAGAVEIPQNPMLGVAAKLMRSVKDRASIPPRQLIRVSVWLQHLRRSHATGRLN